MPVVRDLGSRLLSDVDFFLSVRRTADGRYVGYAWSMLTRAVVTAAFATAQEAEAAIGDELRSRYR